jgi:UDP-2,3-diacylglucosamine pyrophosphatase LpxH
VAATARTPAQHAEVLRLLEQHGGSQTEAAKAAGIKRPTFISQVHAAREWEAKGRPMPAERESFHAGRRLPQTSDECWAVLDDFIGRSKKPAVQKQRTARKSEHERIVIASDFHAPFQDNWAVAELIARESHHADTLIINGDLQDFYSISRFIKYEHVSVESELAAVDALLGQLSAAFHEVVLVSGNHDHHRFEKQLRSLLSLEMVHVIEYLTGGNLSVLKLMAQRYPNVRIAETKVGRFGVSWLYQHGDVICTHAEKYSRVPGAALRGIDEWLTDFDQVLGLDPWRVLVQAHTHAGGVFPFKADRLLVECGCLCATHGYQLQAKIAGRPQRVGYVTLEQERGRTSLNSVRFVWLDADRERVA